MTTVWEDFEIQCTNFLKDKFGKLATFQHQGGADSTVPDILVQTKSGRSFYIEAKHSPAQCGQFVLLPDLKTHTFEYSKLNVNHINTYAQMIIDYMNQDFDAFREAGTAGKDIDMKDGPNIFASWIVHTYQNKGAAFFITNDYVIFPINRFTDYFDVTARYRIKRSGSRNVGKKSLESVQDYISAHDYNITSFHIIKDKLFVSSPQELHNHRFILDGTEYMFSLRNDEYEIRKLSNTYNANVIFSIKLKTSIHGLSDQEFIDCLK